jgi:hypothetical protein
MGIFSALDRSLRFRVEIHTSLKDMYGDSKFSQLKTIVGTPSIESVENHLVITPNLTKSRLTGAVYHFDVLNKAEKGDKKETPASSVGEFLEHLLVSLFESTLIRKVNQIIFIFDDETFIYQSNGGEFVQDAQQIATNF